MKQIGFIGVGQMGAPMAERLLAGGFAVAIYDPDEAALAPLLRHGAQRASSPVEAASDKDIAIACLPDPQVSEAVALGSDGIRHATGLGTYIEMSTIGSAALARIAEVIVGQGIGMLDAPVSGGPRGARAGKLTTMVAGAPESFTACRDTLNAVAKNVFYVGDRPGQGQTVKLANNIISAAAMATSFEAVTMAVKAGIDADTLIDVINASTGRCGATLDKFPQSILPRTFDYGGKLSTMYKDVLLCLEEFRRRGVPHHVSSSVVQMWFQGMVEGRGEDDYTSLIKVVENWAGVRVRGRAAPPEPAADDVPPARATT